MDFFVLGLSCIHFSGREQEANRVAFIHFFHERGNKKSPYILLSNFYLGAILALLKKQNNIRLALISITHISNCICAESIAENFSVMGMVNLKKPGILPSCTEPTKRLLDAIGSLYKRLI